MPTRSEHSFEIFVNFNSSMTKRILFSTNYDEKRSRLAEHERKEFINHRDGGVFCERPRVCDKYAFNQRHHIRITLLPPPKLYTHSRFRVRSSLATMITDSFGRSPAAAKFRGQLMGVSLIRTKFNISETRHAKHSSTSRFKLRSRAQKEDSICDERDSCQSSTGRMAFSSIE